MEPEREDTISVGSTDKTHTEVGPTSFEVPAGTETWGGVYGVLTCLLREPIKGLYWEPQTENPKNIVGI